MSEWRDATVDELCVRVTSGGTPSRKRADFYADEGIPWVKSQELVEARVTATQEHISEAGLKGSSAKLLPVGTVLMAMYGANVGQLGWLGIEATVNQAICAMVTDPQVADAQFFYYSLAGARANLIAQAHGAAQQNLSLKLIKPFTLRVPGLATQRRIGDVLRSIDDLIENNRRRAKVLEEMARTIYREWFVKFRYPGHEGVPLVDSALGAIPKGWHTKTVAELSTIVTRGIAPKYAPDGPTVVLNQKCIRDERISFGPARQQEKLFPAAKQIRRGDVLINSTGIGTLGRVALYRGSRDGVTVDSHVTIARPCEASLNPWYGMSLIAKQTEFEHLGTGSTGQTELGRGDIGAMTLPVPGPDLLAAFSAVVWPLFDEVDVLLASSEFTVALRDILLPKLVTGQIDLSSLDLDRLLERAAA